MSYYDDIGDDNSVLDGDDNYSRYEPIFRVDRCAGSFSVQSYSMLNDATPCRSTVYVALILLRDNRLAMHQILFLKKFTK